MTRFGLTGISKTWCRVLGVPILRGFRSNRDSAAGLVNFRVEWVSHPEDRFLTHPWHRWYLVLLIFGEANASATSSECHRHFRRFLLLMFVTLQDDVKVDI